MERCFISEASAARRDFLKKIAAIGLVISLLIIRFHGHLFAYEEPDGFADLKFGEDLTTQIEKCPSLPQTSGPRCYYPLNGDPFGRPYSLHNMGEIQREVKNIVAYQVDGKLAAVILFFDTSRTSVLLSILRKRYGEPSTHALQPWMPRPTVMSRLVIWKGQNVSITLSERSHQIDEGSILYETEAWVAHLKKIRKGADEVPHTVD